MVKSGGLRGDARKVFDGLKQSGNDGLDSGSKKRLEG